MEILKETKFGDKQKKVGAKTAKIIAFISQKGGVGKSTLSQALAVEAKKQKIKLLLADCDIQQTTSQE
jgi:cellulose biosynthesis protein BcsQ